MAKRKQRVFQHVMESESYQIIKDQIPKEWVIREFNRPDYGIDLVIELFDKIDDKVSETLGEFIYVQVKSVRLAKVKKQKFYSVGNVAKGKWKENRSEWMNIDVVKYRFDTDSIYTIQTLGASVSFLLFLVDIKSKEVYFICMNDYIDKIILPKIPKYAKKKSITISIPVFNNLNHKLVRDNALRFYGKRAKLLAAFSKLYYQKNELAYMIGFKTFPIHTYRNELEKDKKIDAIDVLEQVQFFIEQIKDLDIWEYAGWLVLPDAKAEIFKLKSFMQKKNYDVDIAIEKVIVCWHRLTNLGTMYEDLCREWFLPKMIGLLTSYPEPPEIIKAK